MFKNTKAMVMAMAIIMAAMFAGNSSMVPGSAADLYSACADQGERDASYGLVDHVRTGGLMLFDFSTEGIVGSTNYYGDTIDFEGYCGLKAKCNGSKVTVTMYSNSKDYTKGTLAVRNLGSNKTKDYGSMKVGDSITIDMKDVVKEMNITQKCAFTAVLTPNEKETIELMLWWDDGAVYTAHYNHDQSTDIDKWNNLVKDIDPNKCLEMWVGRKDNPLTYPTSGQNGNCNHVDEWCELSDKICNSNWSDEFKTYYIVEYLAKNYAYDDWRVYENNNVSRATKYKNFAKDSYFMYCNYVGNCWDFANASVIMLRHQGIPATSVENGGHTVTAVYLNDEWYAIDISELAKYHSPLEDASKDNWFKHRDDCYRNVFGYHDGSMKTYNQALSTPELMLTDRSGVNPL